jgi:2-polyprenyl-3-methyl-5-hydroxy-6-metoxy-1,4-benzoquinol methylase
LTRIDLRRRELELTELMDDPGCDHEALRRTYAQFRYLNAAVSGWRRVYRRRIRPLLSADDETTLLDVGSGGGDVARTLARWAARDGVRLSITGIDPDERAHAYASGLPAESGVVFRRASTADLVETGEQFDVVVSNHLLHHLSGPDLRRLVSDSERLTRRLVVHNDLARSRLAYAAWAVVSWPLRRSSFVHVDGLRSIRRSYRVPELAGTIGQPWTVVSHVPAHLLLVRAVPVAVEASAADRTSTTRGAP